VRLKEIDLDEWERSAEDGPKATLFHTRAWLEILREGFPHVEVRAYRIVDEAKRTIGLLPMQFCRKGPFRLAGSPLPGLLTPYQGPVLFKSADTTIEQVQRLAVKSFRPDYFTLSVPPEAECGRLPNVGLRDWQLRKTLLLDLTVGPERLWEAFDAETRNQVRQATRRGAEIYEPASLGDWLETYSTMHAAVYRRQGARPPANPAFFNALWTYLWERQQLAVVLAKHEQQVIAGGLFVICQGTIYFLDGASFREYQHLRGNNLIQWYTISQASLRGLRLYDLAGANIPSITHFKRGFGGSEAEYPYYCARPTLAGKLSYLLYQRCRPLLKKLGL